MKWHARVSHAGDADSCRIEFERRASARYLLPLHARMRPAHGSLSVWRTHSVRCTATESGTPGHGLHRSCVVAGLRLYTGRVTPGHFNQSTVTRAARPRRPRHAPLRNQLLKHLLFLATDLGACAPVCDGHTCSSSIIAAAVRTVQGGGRRHAWPCMGGAGGQRNDTCRRWHEMDERQGKAGLPSAAKQVPTHVLDWIGCWSIQMRPTCNTIHIWHPKEQHTTKRLHTSWPVIIHPPIKLGNATLDVLTCSGCAGGGWQGGMGTPARPRLSRCSSVTTTPTCPARGQTGPQAGPGRAP